MKVCLYLSVLCNKLVLSTWCAYIQVLPTISLYAFIKRYWLYLRFYDINYNVYTIHLSVILYVILMYMYTCILVHVCVCDAV